MLQSKGDAGALGIFEIIPSKAALDVAVDLEILLEESQKIGLDRSSILPFCMVAHLTLPIGGLAKVVVSSVDLALFNIADPLAMASQ